MELTRVIEELAPIAALNKPDEDNIILLLLLGRALTKANSLKDASEKLTNGIDMLTDPKQDRIKKDFALALISLGEQMIKVKSLKEAGFDMIFKYRNTLIE